MTTDGGVVSRARLGLCEFPGVECPNPKPVEPGSSGRPPKYCGQEGPAPDGGRILHNKANAHNAKKPRRAGGDRGREDPAAGSAPVIGESTAARLTLEQQMLSFPRQVDQLKDFLTGIVENVRAFGDPEAVAAEVEQLKAEHRVQIAELERQLGEEEHRRRTAEWQLADAEEARDEADAAAEQAGDELAAARAEAAAAVEAAEQAARAAEDARDAAVAETDQVRAESEARIRETQAAAERRVQEARAEAETARIAAATAETERRTAQETAEQLAGELRQERDRHRAEVDQRRREHRTDREQLRADHQAQLADVKQAAAEQATALTAARRAAEQRVEDLRSQLVKATEQLERATAAEPPAADRRGGGRPSESPAPE